MERTNFGNLSDYIGERYGDWIILDIGVDKKEKGGAIRKTFKCVCECGFCDKVTRDVIAKNILKGRSSGCGKRSRVDNGKKNKKENIFKEKDNYFVVITFTGHEFFIDKEDKMKIEHIYWGRHDNDGYIKGRDNEGKSIFIHNLIMNNIEGEYVIDHINGNASDNRKENLRKCTQSENMKNLKKYSNNKSGHKGVCWAKNEFKWKAYIYVDKKKLHLGTFNNIEDAIEVRKSAEIKYFGEFNRKEYV